MEKKRESGSPSRQSVCSEESLSSATGCDLAQSHHSLHSVSVWSLLGRGFFFSLSLCWSDNLLQKNKQDAPGLFFAP